ncbi:MAG: hypothetical protein AB1765_04540 [Candidatus Hydrogenedentota bacterium]
MTKTGRIQDRQDGFEVNVSRVPLSREVVLKRFACGSIVSAKIIQRLSSDTFIANFQGLNLITKSEIPFKEGQYIFGKVQNNESEIYLKWIDNPLQGREDEKIKEFLLNNNLKVDKSVIDFIKILMKKNIPLDEVLLKKVLTYYEHKSSNDPVLMSFRYLMLLKKKDFAKIDDYIEQFIKNGKKLKLKNKNSLKNLKNTVNNLSEEKDIIFLFKSLKECIEETELLRFIAGNRLAASLNHEIPLYIPFISPDGELNFIKVKYQKEFKEKDKDRVACVDKLFFTIPFYNLGRVTIEIFRFDDEIFIKLVFENKDKLNLLKQTGDSLKAELIFENKKIKEVIFTYEEKEPTEDMIFTSGILENIDVWI